MGSDRLLEEPVSRTAEPAGEPAEPRHPPALPVPEGLSPRLYFLSLLGPLTIAASLGLQGLLLAVLAIEVSPPERRLLTDYGARLFVPERDVALYIVATLASLAVACILAWRWSRRIRSAPAGAAPGRAWRGLLLQGALALGAAGFSLAQFSAGREYLRRGGEVPGRFLAAMGAAAGLCVLAASIGTLRSGRTGRVAGQVERLIDVVPDPAPRRLRLSVVDLLIPFAIFALFYVPEWRQAAGRFFIDESLFHWDYYAMGPALNYLHGKELGNEISSMYGIGWPMLFASAFAWLGASYGRMVQIGSIYACLYLCGVYLLLRLLLRRPGFAALGTALISLQLLLGQSQESIWIFPSLTPMRFAFDVWCFVALVMHSRREGRARRVWAAGAGAAGGLAVVFSTDTGLYLCAAAAFYWGCLLWQEPRRRELLLDAASFAATALAVLGAALLAAGRGNVFRARFLTGWLESILEFGGGFAQLPLATIPNTPTVLMFALLFFGYLVVAGYTLARLLHRRAGPPELFNGFLAIYGSMVLLHFVGRSGDYTPLRLWIPLGLILINLAGSFYGRAGAYVRARWGERGRFAILSRMPYAVAALGAVLLLAAPRTWLVEPILKYPNLVSARLRGSQPDGLCLLLSPRDICGLPERLAGTAVEVRAIAQELKQISSQGGSFAVIDETGSLFYLAAGAAPWERYPRLFVSMHTRAKLDELTGDLRARPPDYVLTRTPIALTDPLLERWPVPSFGLGPGPDTPYGDAWRELRAAVADLYLLDRTIAPYELWRLRTPAGS